MLIFTVKKQNYLHRLSESGDASGSLQKRQKHFWLWTKRISGWLKSLTDTLRISAYIKIVIEALFCKFKMCANFE